MTNASLLRISLAVPVAFALALLATGCGGSDNKTSPDAAPPADAAPPGDAAGVACFTGTPTTSDQLINACVDQSVTVIVKKPMLPLLNADGSLPTLP